LVLGSSNNPKFGQVFGSTGPLPLTVTFQWSNNNLLGNVMSGVDHIGITYNFVSKVVLVCGGLQVYEINQSSLS